MAVLLVGSVVFFGSDHLVVVLEAVDIMVAGYHYRDSCGRVLLFLAVSTYLGANSII